MGAVWGYTGTPDPLISVRMTTASEHRGNSLTQSADGQQATIAWREPHVDAGLGIIGPGLVNLPAQDLTVALCGWVSGTDDSELLQHLNLLAGSNRRSTGLNAIARRYREIGSQVIDRLRGAFVLAIRDGSTIHLARDGAGNRTVFYGRAGERWLFGIEPKFMTTIPEFSRRIRPAAIAQYLACSFVPGRGTMLEDLYELQAGHAVALQHGREPLLRRWFCFESLEQDNAPTPAATLTRAVTVPVETDARTPASLSDDAFVKRFREDLERAVAERIPRNEPVGVFLSGGLDSSVITAELARQIGGQNVRTWAIHFGPKYRNELEFARAVAERCGTRHEEVQIQPKDFLSRFRKMIWHLDDPIGDPITQPNYELAAHVSQHVRFIFNGEGGDPCFGGPKNLPMMLHHWYGGLERDERFRERHYLQSYRRAWDEIEYLLSPELRREIDIERDLDSLFTPYLQTDSPRLFLNRLTAINIREKGAHLIQPKVERMLGAHGLVPLAPLFDERLIEFSFRMPARLKLDRGQEKIILKRAYERELPAEVIGRPKSGMRVPVHYWFRSEMRRYARHILRPKAVRQVGLFNPDRVRQLLNYDIEEGRGRYGLRLWMLITLELWRRIVVDGETV